MNSSTNALVPNVTTMIRLDNTHRPVTFHQCEATSRPNIKCGLVNASCVALKVHAQLEDEIFCPSMREVRDRKAISKSLPEHDEMRRLVALLRGMEPEATRYDDAYTGLMRNVMHHLATEETMILPEAERLIQDRLGALGNKMIIRRMELIGLRTKNTALNMARAMPGPSMVMIAGATHFRSFSGRSLDAELCVKHTRRWRGRAPRGFSSSLKYSYQRMSGMYDFAYIKRRLLPARRSPRESCQRW